jgi:hypothetical protein
MHGLINGLINAVVPAERARLRVEALENTPHDHRM